MSIRTERLAAQLKADLGNILQKEYQNDYMLTVTSVRVTPDLSIAKVYISIFSEGGDKEEVFEHLKNRNSEIRGKLASLIKNQVRRVPELQFFLDDTAEYVNRIEGLFKQIRDERKNRDDE
jgi:ribosome-binding factor A